MKTLLLLLPVISGCAIRMVTRDTDLGVTGRRTDAEARAVGPVVASAAVADRTLTLVATQARECRDVRIEVHTIRSRQVPKGTRLPWMITGSLAFTAGAAAALAVGADQGEEGLVVVGGMLAVPAVFFDASLLRTAVRMGGHRDRKTDRVVSQGAWTPCAPSGTYTGTVDLRASVDGDGKPVSVSSVAFDARSEARLDATRFDLPYWETPTWSFQLNRVDPTQIEVTGDRSTVVAIQREALAAQARAIAEAARKRAEAEAEAARAKAAQAAIDDRARPAYETAARQDTATAWRRFLEDNGDSTWAGKARGALAEAEERETREAAQRALNDQLRRLRRGQLVSVYRWAASGASPSGYRGTVAGIDGDQVQLRITEVEVHNASSFMGFLTSGISGLPEDECTGFQHVYETTSNSRYHDENGLYPGMTTGWIERACITGLGSR